MDQSELSNLPARRVSWYYIRTVNGYVGSSHETSDTMQLITFPWQQKAAYKT